MKTKTFLISAAILPSMGNNRVTSDTYGVVTPNNYLSSEIPDNLRLSYWNKSTFDSPFGWTWLKL